MTTVLPLDPRYPNLTRGFNQRWVAHPAYVEVCSTPEDVVAAVRTAYERGLRITVRGGGHCYENFVYGNDGGVILDLTPMRAVYFDKTSGSYAIEAGATLFDVYLVLEKSSGSRSRAVPATRWARPVTSPAAAMACFHASTG